MATPVIDAVVFDLFETLITESGTVTQRASALAARLRVDHEAYRQLWRFRRSDIVLGRSSFSDVLSWIATRLGTSPDEKLVEQLRSERLAEKAAALHTVEPDVLATLATLRTKRLGLAVVTNCFAEDVASWERSPLRPYFDVTVFFGVVAPKGTDPGVIARLNGTVADLLKESAVKAVLSEQGIIPAPSTDPEFFAGYMADEITKWRAVVKSVGAEIK